MMMKKTVAGILAGAVAVSAMAATVSADQDTITLTYDLKTYVEAIEENGSIQYLVKYADSTESDTYMIKGTDVASGLNFSIDNVPKDLEGRSFAGDAYALELTVKALTYTDERQASKSVTDTFKFFDPDSNMTNPFENTTDWISTKLSDAEKDAYKAATGYEKMFDGKNVHLALWDKTNEVKPTRLHAFIKPYDLSILGYSGYSEGEAYGFSSVNVRIWYKVPNKVTVDGHNTWGWNMYQDAYNVVGINYKKDRAPELNDFVGVVYSDTIKNKNGVAYPATAGFGNLKNGELTEKVYPFRTNLKATNWTSADGYVLRTDDVLYNIKTRKSGNNFYTNPVAVINDAIANHEQVTFTFTGYDNYVATANSHLLQQWVEPYRAYGWKTSDSDWYAPTFGQHVYATSYEVLTPYSDARTSGVMVENGYTAQAANPSAYDMYGSYSQAWAVNLFTGALVINSELTMQLSDTDKFQWGSNSLSFDWFTLTDEGKITDAKTFLTSMLLYTPTDWYWDSLLVEVGGETEEVDNGAGLEQEEDVIDEEIVEEVIEEEPVEEEPVEEVVEEVVEEAPVAPAPSAATGNAPVALAVIPVALAAAAVVAKKRG